MQIGRDGIETGAPPALGVAAPQGPAPPLIGPAEDAGPPGGSRESRRIARQGVLRAAKLDIGGSLLDCIMLDISARGARIRFGAPVAVPERATLVLRDGRRHEARRRWSRGTQVGLEFLGRGVATGADARRIRLLLDQVQAADPAAWLPALRHFGDPALCEAAEAMEVAYLRLVAALRPHLPGA